MAGDWLKFEKSTLDKPEVFEIASALDIDPDAVIGKLLRVWDWFDDQSANGCAPVTVRALLDRYSGVTGFTLAMENVGWIRIDGDIMTLPNFGRHNGQTAKVRALSAKRMAKSRNKSDAESDGLCVTKTQPEKKRKEKSIKKERVAPDFENPKIQAAWELWLQSRKEKRNEVKPTARKLQLTKLKKLSKDDAIAMLNNSTANGYTGLFGPNDSKAGSGGSRNNGNANGRADASDFEL